MRTILVALIALLTLATPAGAQGYNPPGTITVSPSNPAPGDTITVTVTGCAPAPGTVDVFIDGVFVGEAQVDAEGNFEASFVVPIEAGGEVGVEARCDDGVLASVIDVITPDLPFQGDDGADDGQGGSQLPRTGADGSVPLARMGVALVAVGCLILVVVDRRRDDRRVEARHG